MAHRKKSERYATKAVVCTMASIFGDTETFGKIKAEADPEKCRKLGHSWRGFDRTVWHENVNEVAEHVLWFKFA